MFAALARHMQSITWRILIPLVLLTVVSNLLMTSVVMRQLNDQLRAASQHDLIQESDIQSEQFKQHIDNLVKSVQFLRGLPVVEVMANYANKDSLESLSESEYFQRLKMVFVGAMRLRAESVQVRLIYRDGRELLRVDSYGERGDLRVVENSELQNKRDRDYFIETVKLREGEVYLSDINLNREYGKIVRPLQAVIRAATPVYDKSGELFGVIVVNQSLLDSFADIESIGDRDHQFYIADKHGEYIYHDDPEKAFRFEFGDSANIRDDFPDAESLFKSAGEHLVMGRSNNGVSPVYALKSIRYNPYNSDDMVVVAAVNDFSHGQQVLQEMDQQIFYLLIAISAVAIFISVIVAKRIANPVVSMRNQIQKTGIHTRGENLPLEHQSEIGDLARAFEQLLQALSERQLQLEKNVDESERAKLLIEENNRKLSQVNQELEQFSYIASHDLQEPLRTVVSFIKLFEERYGEDFDDQAWKFLGFIKASSGRMQQLIRGLLDYSRLGQQSPFVEVSCQELLSEVCDDLQSKIQDRGAVVNYSDLPTISAKTTELRLVFQNLVSNALKFCAPGVKPEVDIAAQRIEGGWRFSVSDNGVGVAEADRQRIFVIFQRLHADSDYEGSGIGLAHCKKIVEQHGGEIYLESTLGEGSIFYFTIKDMKYD